MPLSAEQMQKANQYFRQHGVVPDCPYCPMHGWKGGEIVSVPVMDEQGNAQPGNATVLTVQFICNNCGHITWFDARRLGLFNG